mgnify:CR=1 FL=1
MIRMLVIGYCFGIPSERRLCEEVHLNLAYRWFCRLDLEQRVPDHSTFSKNRHGRFRQSDAFRHLFETVLRRCMKEGLVGGEGFAIDASVIRADASRARGVPSAEAAGPAESSAGSAGFAPAPHNAAWTLGPAHRGAGRHFGPGSFANNSTSHARTTWQSVQRRCGEPWSGRDGRSRR